jgi:DNA glycosylase AlkZ-like
MTTATGLIAAPPAGSVLDRRTLNRALLVRQHLLDRVRRPVPVLVEHLVGLQAQVPRDPYVSLWSRLAGFEPADLERLLLDRAAVRMTLMRTTLHLVTDRDARRLRRVMQPICERGFAGSPFRRQLDGIDLAPVLNCGAHLLAERPLSIAELGSALAEHWPGADPTAMAYGVRYVVPLVQVTPRGLLRQSAAPRLTTLDAWLGGGPDVTGEADDDGAALDSVVLRYLRAFGPATPADVRTWSWLTNLRPVIDRLRPQLRSYRDEAGRELLDVADGVFADPTIDAPVRFTGEYDNLFLSHADRSRVTGDLKWDGSYARQGAFFVDGFLAGAWRIRNDGAGSRLALDPRRLLGPTDRQAVEQEADALRRFLAPDAGPSRVVWLA